MEGEALLDKRVLLLFSISQYNPIKESIYFIIINITKR